MNPDKVDRILHEFMRSAGRKHAKMMCEVFYGGPTMTVDQWEKPIESVVKALRKSATMLESMNETGEVSFKDMSQILHVLQAAETVVRLIPDSIGVLRNFNSERTRP